MMSLRDKQIREVLDEDLNINRRVNDLTNKRVRLSEETVEPSTTRSTELEVSADKLVESLQKIIETKMVAFEYLFSATVRLGKAEKGLGTTLLSNPQVQQSYSSIVINGDFTAVYNQLMRIFAQPTIARNSREAIKARIVELSSGIDSLCYGYRELIQALFGMNSTDKQIFPLVKAQAIYDTVKNQIKQVSFKEIRQGDIDVSIRNVIAELSEDQRIQMDYLQRYGDTTEKSLLKLPIELANTNAKLRAIEDEIGFRLPLNLARTEEKEQKEQRISEYGQLRGNITATNKKQKDDWEASVALEKAGLLKTESELVRQLTQLTRDQAEIVARMRQEATDVKYDDDLMDEKAVIESPDGEELASLNIAIKEKQQVLQRVRDRIAQIDQRQQEINAEYEIYKQQVGQPLRKGFERRFAEPESAESYSKVGLNKMAYGRLKQIASNIAVPSDQIPATSSKVNKKKLIDAILARQASVSEFLSRSTTLLSPPSTKQKQISSASSSASAPASSATKPALSALPFPNPTEMSEEDFYAELDRLRSLRPPRIAPDDEEFWNQPQIDVWGVPEPAPDWEELEEIVIGQGRKMRPFRTTRTRKVMVPRGMYDDSRNDFFKMKR